VIDVFFGESRTYIKDTLMQKLGWKWGDSIWVRKWDPAHGLYEVWNTSEGMCSSPLHERDGKFFFDMMIPGVSRGRLNGARGVVGKVENGVLVIDVRELLSPHEP
jgi:hypothetical protein